MPPTADIIASFANTGPVDSGTFHLAANPAGNDTITLAYTIDGTGAVSLDASTTNTNTTFVNLVNQFDRPGGTAGNTTNSGFFNSAFSLKLLPDREESETPRLTITTLNGGALAIEGQDSNRVDGRNLGGYETLLVETDRASRHESALQELVRGRRRGCRHAALGWHEHSGFRQCVGIRKQRFRSGDPSVGAGRWR